MHSMNFSMTAALLTMVASLRMLETTQVVTPFSRRMHSSMRGVSSVGLAAWA